MLFCSERCPSSVILSDGFLLGFFLVFFEWRHYHFSSLCLLSLNVLSQNKYCFVKAFEIITPATEIYSFMAHQH